MTIVGRIGQFFVFLGLISLVIFVASIFSEDVAILFCPFSAFALALGAFLARRGRRPTTDTGRFRMIRTTQQKFARRPDDKLKRG